MNIDSIKNGIVIDHIQAQDIGCQKHKQKQKNATRKIMGIGFSDKPYRFIDQIGYKQNIDNICDPDVADIVNAGTEYTGDLFHISPPFNNNYINILYHIFSIHGNTLRHQFVI